VTLARTIHFDESDTRVFHRHARTGEWAISGGFEFSNWTEADLTGKARQAFSNGWLGLETFGRATFVAVTQVEPAEREALVTALAQHFVTVYGAPDLRSAKQVAEEEISQMESLCNDHAPNTLLTVSRDLTDAGVREQYRAIEGQPAELIQVAVHGDMGDPARRAFRQGWPRHGTFCSQAPTQ